MGLILPAYMVHTLRFKCPVCSFAFIKQTPSKVAKCPKCEMHRRVTPVIARGFTVDKLDNYSLQKLRLYASPDGQAHIEDIKRRKIVTRDGKKTVIATDSKGREIGEYIDARLPDKKVEFKQGGVKKISQRIDK